MYHKSFLFYSLHQKGNCFILTVLNLLVKSLFFPSALKGKLTFYPANLEFFLYTPFLYFPDSYPHLRVALISF